jgi:5-formyltetrahydrofolate cyclo-ligase
MQSRPVLRRRLRAARRALSPSEQRAHADRVAARLARLTMLRKARRIALYWPADGELDPRPLLDRLISPRRRWYLPVLHPHAPGVLWFARLLPSDPLRPNRFGIPESGRRGRHLCRARALDLVLMPLVGFDDQCHRLGMGGGYYDRTFAFLRDRAHWHRPRLVGLAHECQQLEAIDQQPWDVPLDAIVTEQRVSWCR